MTEVEKKRVGSGGRRLFNIKTSSFFLLMMVTTCPLMTLLFFCHHWMVHRCLGTFSAPLKK